MSAQERLLVVEQSAPTTDDYYTPRWIFERMCISFDLDVAAPPDGIPWIPATRHYSIADDGLLAPWEGRVWMNPPFSSPAAWVAKFNEHRNGVALLPFAKSRWFDSVWSAADAVVALPSTLKFSHRTNNGSIASLCGLFAIGDDCAAAVARVGSVRTTVTPGLRGDAA